MKNSFEYQIRLLTRAMLLSVSYAALGVMIGAQEARAQSAPAEQRTSEATPSLPPVTVTAPEAKRRASSAPTTRADNGTRKRRPQTARRPEPTTAPKAFAVSQDARTGTVGIYANSTSVATKTNTAAGQHSAVAQRRHQGIHPRSGSPGPHRRHPLRSRRRGASGRRQPRRTRDPRRRYQRQFLRQRLPRRRAVFPRSLQRAERRGSEGAEPR